MKNIQSIDDYINQFSPSIKEKLNSIRSTIKIIAPQAEEAIKYGIPTFIFQENLVHFAAFKNHIGFYPTSSGVRTFKDELAQYKTSKGAIQFPINKPVPLLLIKKIVKFRILEIKNKIKR